jgi:hypothetical protein
VGIRDHFEGEREVARGLEPGLPRFLEAARHNPRDAGRDIRRDRRLGILIENRDHRLRACGAGEGGAAGEHLMQHGAAAEDIGSRVYHLAAHLFGRHVGRCAGGCAVMGIGCRAGGGRVTVRPRQLHKSEIQNLDAFIGSNEQIFGLHIAMHEVSVVRSGQTGGDLPRVIHHLLRRKPASLKARAKRFALEQFGDDVRSAFVEPDIVNGEDVRVIELSCGACFLLEPGNATGVRCTGGGDHFDGHSPIEPRITRSVDDAHSTGAQPLDDFVRADSGACHERRWNVLLHGACVSVVMADVYR